jgi:hypothetical protein
MHRRNETIFGVGLGIAMTAVFAVGCSSSPNTGTTLNTGTIVPPPAPTMTTTATNVVTPQQQTAANGIFDGVAQTAQSNGCPNSLLFNQQDQNAEPFGQNGNYIQPGNGAFGGSLNNPSPALNFFNNNVQNGYYNAPQYNEQNGYYPGYNYPWAGQNGFTPNQTGYNCMNNLGNGTAQIGQIAQFYNPEALREWNVQLLVYLYYANTLQGTPDVINVGGGPSGPVTFIYFPN